MDALGAEMTAAEPSASGPALELAFEAFFRDTEPKLRRALVATYGPDQGRDAAAEALAYAWEHWERLSKMANPAGVPVPRWADARNPAPPSASAP